MSNFNTNNNNNGSFNQNENNGMLYQQNMNNGMMQQQNLNNGYSRTLSKGFANLTLLISIIFFGIGLVLFLLS